MSDDQVLKVRPALSRTSRRIVDLVFLSSIVLFAALTSHNIAMAVGLLERSSTGNDASVATLLSAALIWLAWRRADDLTRVQGELAEAAKREQKLVYQDEVTGLFNRRHLMEQLTAHRGGSRKTLVIIDLDHFKKVNDLYGHAGGDLLLLETARRMKICAPVSADCVRLGGDEFAILLTGASAEPQDALEFAEELICKLNEPVGLKGTVMRVSASIGLTTTIADKDDAAALLRRGDIAMYEAKRLGRARCVWFDVAMERELDQRNQWEAEIRQGIIEGRFIPYFQPMLELSSGQVNGFEVLARWDHPTRGIIEPDDFISIAEATGMIADLSFSVMKSALLRAAKWPGDTTIAVNVSPVQFKDPLLAQRIIKLLHETGFPARRLEIEITESAVLADKGLALSTIASLKNSGVRISLDDFGTGYASLSQLRELPFDRIKIDRSFVATLIDDKQSSAIVHAIAALGKSLNLPITAEGVESESVHQRLVELGCTDAQGWHFGKAISGHATGEAFFGLNAESLPAPAVDETAVPTEDRIDHQRRSAG